MAGLLVRGAAFLSCYYLNELEGLTEWKWRGGPERESFSATATSVAKGGVSYGVAADGNGAIRVVGFFGLWGCSTRWKGLMSRGRGWWVWSARQKELLALSRR